MNILFITQLYPLSQDSENSFALHYFVKEWNKKHHVQVIRPHLPMETEALPKSRKIMLDGVSVDIVKPIWIPVLKIALINRKKILSLIKTKPDVIVCHLYNSYLTFNFLKNVFHVPFVVGIHNSDVKIARHLFYRIRIKNALAKADKIVYRSYSVKDNFENRIPANNINKFVALSGIPAELIEKAKELQNTEFTKSKNLKIISVCSLIPLKQIDKVIIALNEINHDFVNWEYTIIGDGPEKQKLADLTKEFKLENKIKFLGRIPRNEVFNQLGNNNVFIQPSFNETFGLVYLEAMANGCIAIGSKGWGIDGVVVDGQNGFLCDPFNQQEINETLKRVLSMNENELDSIRRKSLETVANYSDEQMARKYFEEISIMI